MRPTRLLGIVLAVPLLLSSCSRDRVTSIQNENQSLAANVDTYSESIDAVSAVWVGEFEAIDQLRAYEGRRPDHSPTGDFPSAVLLSSIVGIRGLGQLQALLAETQVRLHHYSVVSDEVSQLPGIDLSNLSNEQWVAALMTRTIHAVRVSSAWIRSFQLLGIEPWIEAIEEPQTDFSRMVRYAAFASAFNAFVDSAAQTAGTGVERDWRLSVDPTLTPDQTLQEVGRVESILPNLPLGWVPLSPESELRRDRHSDPALKVTNSFLGALGKEILSPDEYTDPYAWAGMFTEEGWDLVPSDYFAGSRRFAYNFFSDLASGYLLEFGLEALRSTSEGGSWIRAVACGIDLGTSAAGLATAIGGFVTTGASGVGAVVFTGRTAIALIDVAESLENCVDDFTTTEADALAQLAESFRDDGTIPPTRDVNALTNPDRAECDQLRAAAVRRERIKVSQPFGTDRFTFDQLSVDESIAQLAGTGSASQTPANTENAMAALLLDLGRRHPETLQPEVSPDRILSLFASVFALLVRREPGDATVGIPGIEEGELICSSPGYVPEHTLDPMDLNEINSLPELTPFDELSPGGSIVIS